MKRAIQAGRGADPKWRPEQFIALGRDSNGALYFAAIRGLLTPRIDLDIDVGQVRDVGNAHPVVVERGADPWQRSPRERLDDRGLDRAELRER
jgi:hypothetical protein